MSTEKRDSPDPKVLATVIAVALVLTLVFSLQHNEPKRENLEGVISHTFVGKMEPIKFQSVNMKLGVQGILGGVIKPIDLTESSTSSDAKLYLDGFSIFGSSIGSLNVSYDSGNGVTNFFRASHLSFDSANSIQTGNLGLIEANLTSGTISAQSGDTSSPLYGYIGNTSAYNLTLYSNNFSDIQLSLVGALNYNSIYINFGGSGIEKMNITTDSESHVINAVTLSITGISSVEINFSGFFDVSLPMSQVGGMTLSSLAPPFPNVNIYAPEVTLYSQDGGSATVNNYTYVTSVGTIDLTPVNSPYQSSNQGTINIVANSALAYNSYSMSIFNSKTYYFGEVYRVVTGLGAGAMIGISGAKLLDMLYPKKK